MTHLTSYLGDNTRKLSRQAARVVDREKNERAVIYLRKQLLKEQLENILRELYFFPDSRSVAKVLSPKLSRTITLSHPLLERMGFASSLHISKPLFLLFISLFSMLRKWIKIDFLHLDNLEYLSPEEGQLVARFQLSLAIKNRRAEQIVFLRIALDSNGDITGWQERWSESNLNFESQSLYSSNNTSQRHSSADSSVTEVASREGLDVSVIQKNLLNAFLRKKIYIQRSEWYQSRVNTIINWSKEQAPKQFTSVIDLRDIYSEFVELENPFVVAFGISAVQQVHQGIRILTKMLFEHVDCTLVSIVHPNPETVIALYRIYGKGRFLGGRVQYLSRNIMTIDLEGKIVRHQETWNVERNEIVKMWLSSE